MEFSKSFFSAQRKKARFALDKKMYLGAYTGRVTVPATGLT